MKSKTTLETDEPLLSKTYEDLNLFYSKRIRPMKCNMTHFGCIILKILASSTDGCLIEPPLYDAYNLISIRLQHTFNVLTFLETIVKPSLNFSLNKSLFRNFL